VHSIIDPHCRRAGCRRCGSRASTPASWAFLIRDMKRPIPAYRNYPHPGPTHRCPPRRPRSSETVVAGQKAGEPVHRRGAAAGNRQALRRARELHDQRACPPNLPAESKIGRHDQLRREAPRVQVSARDVTSGRESRAPEISARRKHGSSARSATTKKLWTLGARRPVAGYRGGGARCAASRSRPKAPAARPAPQKVTARRPVAAKVARTFPPANRPRSPASFFVRSRCGGVTERARRMPGLSSSARGEKPPAVGPPAESRRLSEPTNSKNPACSTALWRPSRLFRTFPFPEAAGPETAGRRPDAAPAQPAPQAPSVKPVPSSVAPAPPPRKPRLERDHGKLPRKKGRPAPGQKRPQRPRAAAIVRPGRKRNSGR